ncbi:hypothetical protein ACFLYO_05440 [Chloroflexota bacterium]
MIKETLETLVEISALLLSIFLALVIWVKYRKQQAEQQLPAPFDISPRAYHVGLVLSIIVYLILAVLLAITNYDRLNPDAVSYLTIAQRYAQGEFVVRGYWSPLISWLLAPPIALGIGPQLSVNILMVIVGLVFSLLCLPLAKRFGLGRLYRLGIFIVIAIISLYYLFTDITPDLLGGIFVLLYFLVVTDRRYLERPVSLGSAAGLVGALAYYGKYYNIAFVAVHLIIHAGLLFFSRPTQRKQILLATSTALAALFILISPWIYGIYQRYDTITISTSAAANRAIVGPPLADGSSPPGHQCWGSQLCDKPDDTLFPWEDPQIEYYIPWSPFDNTDNLTYFVKLVASNIKQWPETLTVRHLQSLSVLILGLSLVAAILFWKDTNARHQLIWLLLTIALYSGGYMLNYSGDFRYYLPIIPLVIILTFYWVQVATQIIPSAITNPRLQSICTIGLVGLTILSSANPYSILWHILNKPTPIACYDTDTRAIAEQLMAPVVGEGQYINYVSYFTQQRTIGVIPAHLSPAETHAKIQQYDVNTLVINPTKAAALQDEFGYTLVEELQICDTDYAVLRPPAE